MVLILDGDSEIIAKVRTNLCYLICIRYLIKKRAVTNRIFTLKSLIYRMCAQHVLSYHLIEVPCFKQIQFPLFMLQNPLNLSNMFSEDLFFIPYIVQQPFSILFEYKKKRFNVISKSFLYSIIYQPLNLFLA